MLQITQRQSAEFNVNVMAVEAPHRSTSTPSPLAKAQQDWLSWLAELLPEHAALSLVIVSASRAEKVHTINHPATAKFPDAAYQIAQKANQSRRPISVKLGLAKQSNTPTASNEKSLVAIPLEQKLFCLLLVSDTQQAEQLAATVKLCQWASRWLLPTLIDKPSTANAPAAQQALPAAILQSAFQHNNPEAVARTLVNTLKKVCGCERVSLSVLSKLSRDKNAKLLAISDQAEIDPRKVLPAQLTAAMAECMVLNQDIRMSMLAMVDLRWSHPECCRLFEQQGRMPALVLVYSGAETTESPINDMPATQVSLILEKTGRDAFSDAQHTAIRALVTPILHLLMQMHEQQLSLTQRLRLKLKRMALLPSLIATDWRYQKPALMIAVALMVAFMPIEHRFSAKAIIEAKDLQVLVAPHDGFVATAHSRAGDAVKVGDVLATLDTQALELTNNKWSTEAAKNDQAFSVALAQKDRVALRKLSADTRRIAAEQQLVQQQLARAELRSPFDGVVLSGDLSQKLGSAVNQGDTLFTVAASDEYRLLIRVDEQDVGLVKPDQPVEVKMAALPNQSWYAIVESVSPVAVGSVDANVFDVPARLIEHTDELLPGMEGVAKISVGTESLIWVYTRSLREKLSLTLWRIGLLN